MIRPLLFLKRFSFDESTGKVSYKYGKERTHEESMDYLEFIARVTSYIPDKGEVISFLVVDLVVLDVILLFQNVRGWKLWKMVEDLEQGQKANSYL